MKVPPSSAAASSTAASPVPQAASSTPTASARQAAAKARGRPIRRPAHSQSATDGAAASPTQSHTACSAGRRAGSARIMSQTKVAVTT